MNIHKRLAALFWKTDSNLEKSLLLVSIRRGLTFMIPFLLIGSFALLVTTLPIPSYQHFMLSLFGGDWKNAFEYVRDGTFNILSIIMALCISYSYANENWQNNRDAADPFIASIVSLSSLIALTGFGKETFSIKYLGVVGIFLAVITSTASTKMFIKLCSVRLFRIKAFTDGANPAFNDAIASVFPAAITISLFALINQLLTSILDIPDIQSFLSDTMNLLFQRLGSSIASALLFIFLIHVFWFFGIHGSNVLEPVAQKIFVPAMNTNISLVHNNLPPTEIFTKTSFDTFVLMGGCGSTLCLIFAIFLSARLKSTRRHAKLSLLPVFFNINELIVFGIPIVLNPVYLVPFLSLPIILTSITYLTMVTGLVPYTHAFVEWTTPILLSGYTATGSIKGSLLQIFNLAVGIVVYLPFVKLAERKTAEQMAVNLEKVYKTLKENEDYSLRTIFTNRHDDIGNISRHLTADLQYALQNDQLDLFYQPQVNYAGQVFGIEALLRWKHEIYGYIYPPLIIALAEEGQFMDKLGSRILDTACRSLKELMDNSYTDIVMSVNTSAYQLENDFFTHDLKEAIAHHGVPSHLLKIEITEQTALTGTKKLLKNLRSIKRLGVKIAMDDFGMGHSSLMYLKEYDIDTIKIDGSLVREILTNSTCGDIISSIVYLSKSVDFAIVAEYVETSEQREELHRLGCDQYQGYLYSPAIPAKDLITYIKENRISTASF